jgi:hypothetical protein
MAIGLEDKGGYTGYLVGIADDPTELVTLLVNEKLALDTLEALPVRKSTKFNNHEEKWGLCCPALFKICKA